MSDPVLTVHVATPTPGTELGDQFEVTGGLSVTGGDTDGLIKKVEVVWVSVDDGGQNVRATLNGTGFRCTRAVQSGTAGGTSLTITVHAQVVVTDNRDKETHEAEIEAEASVAVVYSQRPPGLSVVVPEWVTYPAPVQVAGTASDDSGLTSVQYSVDGAAFADVDNPVGSWNPWSKTLPLDPGVFGLRVRATGAAPHFLVTERTATIEVRVAFEPTELDQVFEPTTYLRELLNFARQQVRIGVATAGPTPEQLTEVFHQPFHDLTVSANFEQAVAQVSQARIAAEVLRHLLPPGSTGAVDQAHRAAVYRAILSQLGTSYDELRLGRVRDAASRNALAARLGITPDQLQLLMIPEASITDAQLADLFGYRSTAAADPLQAATAPARVLTWQTGVARELWRAEDSRDRDRADVPAPIVDPDLLDRAAIRGTSDSTPAGALWDARSAWLAATLAQIHSAEQSSPDLAGFDLVVRTFIGVLDLPALAERDADGDDVSPDLHPVHLDLAGFRFLATARALLAADQTLDAEWDDVEAITLAVAKRGQYPVWRAEERAAGVVLDPGQFDVSGIDPTRQVPRWRGSASDVGDLRRVLRARTRQLTSLADAYQAVLDAAEEQTLPSLRQDLLALVAAEANPPEDPATTTTRLSRELMIDLRTAPGTRTTRVGQALDTLQGALFAARSGRVTTGQAEQWLVDDPSFDPLWVWMGGHDTWVAAMRIFAYPENQLTPNLYLPDGAHLTPTAAFAGNSPDHPELAGLLSDLRKATTFTPQDARIIARAYLTNLRAVDAGAQAALAADFPISDQLSDADVAARQKVLNLQFSNLSHPIPGASWVHEVFWLVPTAIAMRLEQEREYQAALDWYQTIYAFTRPEQDRAQYPLLAVEASVQSVYEQVPPRWLTTELNPHIIAWPFQAAVGAPLTGRRHAHTRSTLLSIVRCLLAYADVEFAKALPEPITRARTLYQTAVDLLAAPELTPETDSPFPPNPAWTALGAHAGAQLDKIHRGLNIAGIQADGMVPAGQAVSFQPSRYRYTVLIERAKTLTGIAQQVETAYLQALEKREDENYNLLRAAHDIEVASAQITVADLKVADAGLVTIEAELQKGRADIQFDHYDGLISGGLSDWEIATLGALTDAVALRSASMFTDPLGGAAGAASAAAQLTETVAGFERRREGWELERQLAAQDQAIGGVQIAHARNQQEVAVQERVLAGLQLDHATATMNFLARKFTNAELFDWMSGVLERSYAYFLQQATAVALLAQAQLAFERQEAPAGVIRSDYWGDPDGATTGPDRGGLTGSVRLLQDITRLDQYAFQTDQRKLHLTTTLSLARIAATEFQRFRETGVLTFTTSRDLFDQDYPGHYLRLLKRVRVSVVALVPADRGIRATLSASGLSRVVIAGDDHSTVTLVRPPEAISFSAPVNATGLFDLEPDSGALLPFEGMGVETTWRLDLPKPANPFDYRSIADVVLTIDYTAVDDPDLRRLVVQDQGREFLGERAFSIREQFPDSWYDLNNPETLPPSDQMVASLTVVPEDLPPHVTDLLLEHVTLVCVRDDGVTQELRIPSLSHTTPGLPTVTTAEVSTLGGIVGTRRPRGAAWRPLIHQVPSGDWRIQLENTGEVTASLQGGSIQDIVLILTVSGTTPAWP